MTNFEEFESHSYAYLPENLATRRNTKEDRGNFHPPSRTSIPATLPLDGSSVSLPPFYTIDSRATLSQSQDIVRGIPICHIPPLLKGHSICFRFRVHTPDCYMGSMLDILNNNNSCGSTGRSNFTQRTKILHDYIVSEGNGVGVGNKVFPQSNRDANTSGNSIFPISVGLTSGPSMSEQPGLVITYGANFCTIRRNSYSHTQERISDNVQVTEKYINLERLRARQDHGLDVEGRKLGTTDSCISRAFIDLSEVSEFWVIWGEGLVFTGIGSKPGDMMVMAADMASCDYTFAYKNGVGSHKDRYATDEISTIYCASPRSVVQWSNFFATSSWLVSPCSF